MHKTGNQPPTYAEICGPFAWAQLHSWAENLNNEVCSTCGAFAITAAQALHDMVNWKLGKPLQHPESVRQITQVGQRALQGDNPMQTFGNRTVKAYMSSILMNQDEDNFKIVDSPRGMAIELPITRRSSSKDTWVALVNGLDPKYEYSREFLDETIRGSFRYLIAGLAPGNLLQISQTSTGRRFYRIIEIASDFISMRRLTQAELLKILRGEEEPKRYRYVPINHCRDFKTGRWTKGAQCDSVSSRTRSEMSSLLGDMLRGMAGGVGSGVGSGIGGVVSGEIIRRSQTAATQQGFLSEKPLKLDLSGGGDYVRERVANPRKYHPSSFRTIQQGEIRILIACPMSKWSVDKSECEDSTEAVTFLHPRSREKALVQEAKARGVPITLAQDELDHLLTPYPQGEPEVADLIQRLISDGKLVGVST